MSGRTYDLINLWVATVGQVLFVLLWLTQRWWITRVGRALMAKSAVLAALFLSSLWVYYVNPLPVWAGRLELTAITLAIGAQTVAMAIEIWRARRERRPVSGTNPNGSKRPHSDRPQSN